MDKISVDEISLYHDILDNGEPNIISPIKRNEINQIGEKYGYWLNANNQTIPFKKIDLNYARNIKALCLRKNWYIPRQIEEIIGGKER